MSTHTLVKACFKIPRADNQELEDALKALSKEVRG